MDFDTLITIMIIGVIILFIIEIIWIIWIRKNGKYARMKRYINVDIGMREREMLEIMGKGYSVSSYSDGRKKYEWVIDNGILGGVRRVEILVVQKRVAEILPYNV